MLDEKDMLDENHLADASDRADLALRDEEGAIRDEYVAQVTEAIQGRDAGLLRALVGELHESDVGDLIEALDPELRPQLIELMGKDFDFSALTEVDDTVREEILEELPTETVAEGVRELDSDDAVYILEDLPKEEQEEILEQLPPLERFAWHAASTIPEASAGRRMQTEFIAVPPDWTVGQTIDYMRETEDLPERFYETLRDRRVRQVPRRGRARPAVAHQAPGRDVLPDGPGSPRSAPPTTRRRWRGNSSATIWSRRRWSTRADAWSACSPSTTSST